MDDFEIRPQLLSVVRNANNLIDVIELEARTQGVPPESLRYSNGTHVLSPVLAAKAQALHALVLLRAT